MIRKQNLQEWCKQQTIADLAVTAMIHGNAQLKNAHQNGVDAAHTKATATAAATAAHSIVCLGLVPTV